MKYKIGDSVRVNTPGRKLHGATGTVTMVQERKETDRAIDTDYFVCFGGVFDIPMNENELSPINPLNGQNTPC